jgi:hypothetical protein
MLDDVVWLPGRPGGRPLSELLGAQHGDSVEVAAARNAPHHQEWTPGSTTDPSPACWPATRSG